MSSIIKIIPQKENMLKTQYSLKWVFKNYKKKYPSNSEVTKATILCYLHHYVNNPWPPSGKRLRFSLGLPQENNATATTTTKTDDKIISAESYLCQCDGTLTCCGYTKTVKVVTASKGGGKERRSWEGESSSQSEFLELHLHDRIFAFFSLLFFCHLAEEVSHEETFVLNSKSKIC